MQLFKGWMKMPREDKWEDTYEPTEAPEWEDTYEPTEAPEPIDAYECDCDCHNCDYNISPKQLAALALIQTGMVGDLDDPRVDGFWELFRRSLDDCGYIIAEEADEYYC